MVTQTIEQRADKQFLRESRMPLKYHSKFIIQGRKTFRYAQIKLAIAFSDLIASIKSSLKLK